MLDKQQIRELLGEITDFVIPLGQIGDQDDLFNYGMDSLDCVKLISRLEKQYGFKFKRQHFLLENFSSIHSIANTVAKYLEVQEEQ